MVDVPPEVENAPLEYGRAAEPLVWGLVAFAVVYVVGRALVQPALMRVVRRRNERNPTIVDAIGRYTRLVTVVVALLVAVAVSGYGDVFGGSALVIAAATLALGVAGQAVIGNLVSGLFLVVDPDFNVGDRIEWDDSAGVVETIRFRVTRVRTDSNRVIVVPNTTLATSAVTHPYKRDRLRVVANVAVSYDADLQRAIAVLDEEAAELDAVRARPPPNVRVEELGGDAVELRVEFWLDDPSQKALAATRSAFFQRAERRLEAEGIGVSPPSEHDLSGSLRVDRDAEE